MDKLYRSVLAGLILCGSSAASLAGDMPAGQPRAAASRPLRALLVTGGCCHDYERQKVILSRGISARAHVKWTIVHQGGTSTNARIPLYEDPRWAEVYDVVVHNECFAHVSDVEWVERIVKPHREGVPAVLIHCAMHCYRTGTDKWFEFAGVQSPNHGPHYAYTVENKRPDDPILEGFGARWEVPKGELYNTIKTWPTAAVLAEAPRKPDQAPQVCIWTNQYGQGRVFGTTIGHYNETMAEPVYLNMVTRGLLWAAGRDAAAEFRRTDEKTDAEIRALARAPIEGAAPAPAPSAEAVCCGAGSLAADRMATASSEEAGKGNLAPLAVDGDLRTRWCAADSASGHGWQVDLGAVVDVRSVRIHWEASGAAYRYRIEGSGDGQDWHTIVDQSQNTAAAGITPHGVSAAGTRYVRVTFLGSSTGHWASIREFEAFAGPLPPLPVDVPADSGKDAAPGPTDVRPPDGFQVHVFGAPPAVNYPVCLAAAPTGELFVGVDPQGSLGQEPGQGKVLCCRDIDGDGQADVVQEFARIDHPRGLVYDNGSLWVLHPPLLSVYHDDDRDGVSDRHQVLVTGVSTDQVQKRGADHTTNGIRLGIDGWIYIAVGDFGLVQARGTDGSELNRRGGGIIRVRPDGTELEIYCWGLRNIVDVAVDPYLNGFTRDNTNDGGGWDIRLSHIVQTAQYGYPSRYKNFTDETMPALASYGGGSGCGAIYLHDLRWPQPFGDALYTCDWGRNLVYQHNLPPRGATFTAHQEQFLQIPRPTDIDVDGSGRMYVSSWRGGGFSYGGPQVGFVAQVVPEGLVPAPFPDLRAARDEQLVEHLSAPSGVYRLHSQREILRRGRNPQTTARLVALASRADAPLYGRVAAMFTLKQLDAAAAHPALITLAGDAAVREFALRALTDRRRQLAGVPLEPLIAALGDPQPRVRAQALVSLGRLGRIAAAAQILPLTQRADDDQPPTEQPLWNQPDPGRVLPHLAVQALVALRAIPACLEALEGPYRQGALTALGSLHEPAAVGGLLGRLNSSADPSLRQQMLTTLIRLYHREGPYQQGWWGTRPDTSGPYFDRQVWSESPRIADAVRGAMADADAATAAHIQHQLARHGAKIDGLIASSTGVSGDLPPQEPITLPQADPGNPNLIANLSPEVVAARALQAQGDAARGAELFTRQACAACHTVANGQVPKGPHLVDIGERYKPAELVESMLRPSAKIAQGFDTYALVLEDGRVLNGFIVSERADSLVVREANGLARELAASQLEQRVRQETSIMPTGIVDNLTPEQLGDLIAYLQSLH